MNDPLRCLDELGEQFERVARAAPARRRTRGWRRLLVLAIPGALLVAAGAAAAGLLTGEPVRNPVGVTFRADAGLGRPLSTKAKLLSLRVPDPDGGPPWGMRVVGTTRGLSCVQIGRVVDGRLGVLGQDGAFGDDGRFHELPADVLTQAHCQQPDRAGHLFIAIANLGVSGSALNGACVASGQHYPPQFKRPDLPTCGAGDERVLQVGLLGPRATSVTYDDDAGHAVTARVSRPEGAYLVVRRPSRTHPASGGYTPGVSPVVGLRSVQYDGAPRCVLGPARRLGGARACPLVGYLAPRPTHVTAAQVRTRARASFAPNAVTPPTPGAPPGLLHQRQWKLMVVFRARHAGNARSGYAVTVRMRRGAGCTIGAVTGPVPRDVGAGEVVRYATYFPTDCHGTVDVRVTFRPQPSRPDELPFQGQAGSIVVGSATARIPD